MGIGELAAISIGVSMDAFAIAVCKGLSVERVEPKHLWLRASGSGGAQAVMPLLGYFLGSGFRSVIESPDHWISLILLAAIGIHMIRESREPVRKMEASFAPRVMLPLAVADSIDALAVGVSFCVFESGHSSGCSHDWTDHICFLSCWGENRQSVRSKVQIKRPKRWEELFCFSWVPRFYGNIYGCEKKEAVYGRFQYHQTGISDFFEGVDGGAAL